MKIPLKRIPSEMKGLTRFCEMMSIREGDMYPLSANNCTPGTQKFGYPPKA